MADELEKLARKELDRMKNALAGISIGKKSAEAEKVLLLAKSYYSDGEHFFKQGHFTEAFEAAIISWGYIDAGLHLGAFAVSDEIRKSGIFTV
jgi:hypothetical protein